MKTFAIILLSLISLISWAQERFYTSFRYNSVGFHIIENDSSFISIGRRSDVIFENSLYFHEFSLLGDTTMGWVFEVDSAISTDIQYTNGALPGIIGGDIKGELGGVLYPALFNFTDDFTDTTSVHIYQFTGERGGRFSIVNQINDTTLIIAAGMQAANYTLHTSLLKTHTNGEVLWKQDYYCGNDCRTLPYNLISTHDGGFYIGCNEYYHVGTPEQIENMVLIKTDSLGNEEFRYYPGDEAYNIRAGWVIQAEDSNYIISYADPSFAQEWQPWNQNNTIIIEKIDEQGNLLWTNSLLDDLPLYDGNGLNYYITKMEKISDGYIIGGSDGGVFGFLIKIDFDGELLWYRLYDHPSWVENEPAYQRTMINGFTSTSDGGFILTGNYTSFPGILYPNGATMAIAIKVDEYGCLVEGCQLADDITELEENSSKVNIYPNPVSDLLTIAVDESSSQSFSLSIVNLNGQQVYIENNLSTQSNIDVSDLNPGMYLLRLQFENGEQVTRKFVKD